MRKIFNKSLLFFAFLIIIFPKVILAHECDNNDYACISCTYNSEKYETNINYIIKSNGKTISITRDKSSWVKKAKNWTQTDLKYTIGNDNLFGENFIKKDANGVKKLKCLNNIYFLLRNMSSIVDVYSEEPGGQSDKLSLSNQYNNNKNVYSEGKVKSCTYKLFQKSSMGYQTIGNATIVSDGNNIISQSFSNPNVIEDKNANYSNIAKLFDVNAGDGKGCPNLYVVCYQNICTISTNGISGWDNSGNDTKTADELEKLDPEEASKVPTADIPTHNCTSLLGDPNDKSTPSPAFLLSYAFKVLRYVAIILLVVLSIMDFVSSVSSQDTDSLKKAVNKTIRRAILCVIIFLLPYIIEYVLSFLNDNATKICIST